VPRDVFIAGGGPAGLAAAIAARLKGFDVTVADAARPPIDKACGEGLLPSSLGALERLGIEIGPDDAIRFRGIRFISGLTTVEACFPSGYGLAIRRTRLHQILIDRASDVGVRLLWGTRAEPPAGAWLIGADGQNSLVRRAAGLDQVIRESRRFGFRRHYRIAPWTDFVEVHWGPRCQMYITPVGRDEIGVALLASDPHLRLDSALNDFPTLLQRLKGAVASSTERGAVTLSRQLRSVYRDRTVLIGDASGSLDAITGEGLSLSLHQAIALADALTTGDLARYQLEHRRLARRPMWMADLMLILDRAPWLQQPVFRSMALQPAIFEKLLAMHSTPRPGVAAA
jgi:flavin-dependent dehydrogenase